MQCHCIASATCWISNDGEFDKQVSTTIAAKCKNALHINKYEYEYEFLLKMNFKFAALVLEYKLR